MKFKAPKTIRLWEPRFSKTVLKKMYADGPRAFRRGMWLDPYSEEERKIPHFAEAWKRGAGITVEGLLEKYPKCDRFQAMDPGGKSRPGTALFTLGQWGPLRFPLAIRFGQWGPREVGEQLIEEYLRWKPLIVYCENNALQDAFIDIVELLNPPEPIPIKGFQTGRNKADPDIGIEGLDAEISQGYWVFPAGECQGHEVNCECDWCRWRNEMTQYPNWETTDGVMAAWFAWNAARRSGGDAPPETYGKTIFGEGPTSIGTELLPEEEDGDLESADI